MKKVLFSSIVIAFLSVNSYAEFNINDTSLGADIGTTGVGITAVKKIKGYNDKWGIRLGYHQYSKNYTTTDDNTDYDFDLDLQDFQIMADYHPWNTAFKITFGALYNGTDLSGNIKPSGTTIVVEGVSYNINQVGSVDTKVDFDNNIAPYLGIGWDTSFYKPHNSWGFTFNLGVAYTGSAKVSYTPHYGSAIDAATKAQLENDLEDARISLQNDLDDYKYLPFISIGFNYKF